MNPVQHLRSYAAVALLTMALTGCSGQPEVANRHSPGTAIVCFGDSLTRGEGASEGHEYPGLLAAALGRDVINAGANGDTTRDALERLEQDVLLRNPRLVIVELGGNDFLRQVPRAETFTNLEAIVRRIQERGAMVVLVGVQSGLFGDPARREYQRIARARKTAFIPNIVEDILNDPRLKSDGLHPNDAGYQVMAERILKTIQPLLAD